MATALFIVPHHIDVSNASLPRKRLIAVFSGAKIALSYSANRQRVECSAFCSVVPNPKATVGVSL
jgi:hypothetical protein